MTADEAAPPPFTVLLVCTGNICRSALGECLGRAFVDHELGAVACKIRIVSAGTRAVVGSPMHADSALVLSSLGADPGRFRARQLTPGMATGADLTLVMTREHRHVVLHQSPRAMSRTFTLLEAADLLDRLTSRPIRGETFHERARELVRQMSAARSHRHAGGADDVRDPIGQPLEVHDQVGALIADSLLPILRRIGSLDGP